MEFGRKEEDNEGFDAIGRVLEPCGGVYLKAPLVKLNGLLTGASIKFIKYP